MRLELALQVQNYCDCLGQSCVYVCWRYGSPYLPLPFISKHGCKYGNLQTVLAQVMGGKQCARIEQAIHQEHTQGRASYFGEATELLSWLQLQED